MCTNFSFVLWHKHVTVVSLHLVISGEIGAVWRVSFVEWNKNAKLVLKICDKWNNCTALARSPLFSACTYPGLYCLHDIKIIYCALKSKSFYSDGIEDGTVGFTANINVPEHITFGQDLDNLYAFWHLRFIIRLWKAPRLPSLPLNTLLTRKNIYLQLLKCKPNRPALLDRVSDRVLKTCAKKLLHNL